MKDYLEFFFEKLPFFSNLYVYQWLLGAAFVIFSLICYLSYDRFKNNIEKNFSKFIAALIIILVFFLFLSYIFYPNVPKEEIRPRSEFNGSSEKIDGAFVYNGVVYTKDNKKAALIAIVFREYSWKLGSSSKIEVAGTGVETSIERYILTPGIKAILDRYDSVITIGMSSYEMSGEGLTVEEERARGRAKVLLTKIKENTTRNMEFHLVSLGRNINENVRNSGNQRVVALLGVGKIDDKPFNFNVSSILNKEIFAGLTDIGVNIFDYSEFYVE